MLVELRALENMAYFLYLGRPHQLIDRMCYDMIKMAKYEYQPTSCVEPLTKEEALTLSGMVELGTLALGTSFTYEGVPNRVLDKCGHHIRVKNLRTGESGLWDEETPVKPIKQLQEILMPSIKFKVLGTYAYFQLHGRVYQKTGATTATDLATGRPTKVPPGYTIHPMAKEEAERLVRRVKQHNKLRVVDRLTPESVEFGLIEVLQGFKNCGHHYVKCRPMKKDDRVIVNALCLDNGKLEGFGQSDQVEPAILGEVTFSCL